jgi:hypothetical protein
LSESEEGLMSGCLPITPRAAEALKPFMDEGLRLEREGYFGPTYRSLTAGGFLLSEWRELLAAWRESQAVCEGIRLEDGSVPKAG